MATNPILEFNKTQATDLNENLIRLNERLSSIFGGFGWPRPNPGDPVDILRQAGLDESAIRNVVSIQLNTRAAATEHYAEALKLEANASRQIATAMDKIQVKRG